MKKNPKKISLDLAARKEIWTEHARLDNAENPEYFSVR